MRLIVLLWRYLMSDNRGESWCENDFDGKQRKNLKPFNALIM